MPPIPCAHCGNNFMRPTNDPEAPKLCNNCIVREETRKIKGETKMQTIKIEIDCPVSTYPEIEEFCINKGISVTKYFLDLHSQKNHSIPPLKYNEEGQSDFTDLLEDEKKPRENPTKKYKGK